MNDHWLGLAAFLLDFNDTLPDAKKETIPKEILDYYLGSDEDIEKDNFKKFTKVLFAQRHTVIDIVFFSRF